MKKKVSFAIILCAVVLEGIKALQIRYILYTVYNIPGLPRLEKYAPSLYWYITQNYIPIFTVNDYLHILY